MTLVLRRWLESALEPACRQGVRFQSPLTKASGEPGTVCLVLAPMAGER